MCEQSLRDYIIATNKNRWIILFPDFSKALDCLEWEFMYQFGIANSLLG